MGEQPQAPQALVQIRRQSLSDLFRLSNTSADFSALVPNWDKDFFYNHPLPSPRLCLEATKESIFTPRAVGVMASPGLE
jgi:hypothetical protein